jgi:hypothetical protein
VQTENVEYAYRIIGNEFVTAHEFDVTNAGTYHCGNCDAIIPIYDDEELEVYMRGE